MFDPYHNAVNNYYFVRGNLSGSWLGLPSDAIIMNWNLLRLSTSTNFFAGRGHRQIIAGYFDSRNGARSASNELSATQGVSGIVGLMYTTWFDNYTELENYAAATRPPTITVPLTDQRVMSGQPVTFTVVVTGPAPLRYQWQRNEVDIVGETAASYIITAATSTDDGAQFRYRVSNLGGYVTSNSATLMVRAAQNVWLPLMIR